MREPACIPACALCATLLTRATRPFARWGEAVLVVCILLSGCRSGHETVGAGVELSQVPHVGEGGPDRFETIEGRVVGARPGQQIVLFARSGVWWVQPLADQPFTEIQPDSTWKNSTHLGTEYAALLVEPGYRPPATMDALPAVGGAVVAVAAAKGEPMFWQTRLFQLSCLLACVLAALAWYRVRMLQVAKQLNVRFEERLAERTRIAQELHDTLLQGLVSASMQLHVAADHVPEDSPAKPQLGRVLELMGQVIDEGRNAVRGLRSPDSASDDLETAFYTIRQELAVEEQVGFRVVVEGRPRSLHPIIRDEIYRVGREALVNAFRHSRATNIEVEVEYAAKRLRVLVRDDGCGIDPQLLESGRDGHWGLSGMRERAERIGARLSLRSRAAAGTEVELSVPNHVAFQFQSPDRSSGWLAGWNWRKTGVRESESEHER